MERIFICLFFILSLCVLGHAQATTTTESPLTTEKKAKKPTFRATKDQVIQAQKILIAGLRKVFLILHG